MIRKLIRVAAVLLLIGSIAVGSFATYIYLAPSDEEKLYDQKHHEAIEKLKKAENARGTAAEAQLARD